MPGHYIEAQDSRGGPTPDSLDFDDDGELVGVRVVGARARGRVRSRGPASSTSSSCAATSRAATSPRPSFQRVRFVDCRCSASSFGRATWRTVTVDRLPVRRGELPPGAAHAGDASTGSDCARADFGARAARRRAVPGCDLSGADVSNAKCANVDLRGRAARRSARRRVAARRDDRHRAAVRSCARAWPPPWVCGCSPTTTRTKTPDRRTPERILTPAATISGPPTGQCRPAVAAPVSQPDVSRSDQLVLTARDEDDPTWPNATAAPIEAILRTRTPTSPWRRVSTTRASSTTAAASASSST